MDRSVVDRSVVDRSVVDRAGSAGADRAGTKAALIVEGGAMRSVFSAGVLDGFLKEHFNPFDFVIGVSGGAYNAAAYLAGKPGQSLKVFTELAMQGPFISYWRFLSGGHLLDLDWLFDAAIAQALFTPAEVFHAGKPLFVTVTDVQTGEPHYVATDEQSLTAALKASTALPLFYRGFPLLNGRPMSDGGIADPIPFAEALRRGATKVLVVRNRERGYRKTDNAVHKLIRWNLRAHPAVQRALRERVSRYEEVLALMNSAPSGVQVQQVYPPREFTAGRFNTERTDLLAGYEAGLVAAQEAILTWKARDQEHRRALAAI